MDTDMDRSVTHTSGYLSMGPTDPYVQVSLESPFLPDGVRLAFGCVLSELSDRLDQVLEEVGEDDFRVDIEVE